MPRPPQRRPGVQRAAPLLRTPEVPANLAFGGPDLRTLFFTARTSLYTLRVKVPGQPHPWYRRAQRRS